MKQTKLFFAIAFTLMNMSQNSFGQYKWSGGYQLGVGNSNLPVSNMTGYQDNDMKPLLTNQLFIKRKITGKLDLESGLGITLWNKNMSEDIQYNEIKNIAFNLTLTAKFTIFQKAIWNLYLPFGINSMYYKSKTNYYQSTSIYPWFNVISTQIQIVQNIFTGMGINHDVGKHLYLNGQGIIGYKLYNAMQSFDRADNNSTNISYGFQAGIGYHF